eukprot:4107403-Prymnesium_polylepis.1
MGERCPCLQQRSRSAVCSPPGEHAQHHTQHCTRTAHASAAPIAFGAMSWRVRVRYRIKFPQISLNPTKEAFTRAPK